jgi:hypothetical protein
MRHYAQLTGTAPIDYPCQLHLEPSRDGHRDLDLWRLLNAWGTPRDPIERDVNHGRLPASALPNAPRVLWIATSFGWAMMDDAELSGRFPELHVNYYNNAVASAGERGSFPADPRDARWRAIVPNRELYVVELFETYLTPGAFFGADALDALDAALGPEATAEAAR